MDIKKCNSKEIVSDYEELIKKAQKQPGINELITVYGNYQSVIKKSNEYLMGVMPRSVITTNNQSTYR